ncbi:hypothetical protein ON010_g754 [Phytophthora cinnamomi]|nr:hypothetical protein ON010_g754 [Phytophthora cinnamomi]
MLKYLDEARFTARNDEGARRSADRIQFAPQDASTTESAPRDSSGERAVARRERDESETSASTTDATQADVHAGGSKWFLAAINVVKLKQLRKNDHRSAAIRFDSRPGKITGPFHGGHTGASATPIIENEHDDDFDAH